MKELLKDIYYTTFCPRKFFETHFLSKGLKDVLIFIGGTYVLALSVTILSSVFFNFITGSPFKIAFTFPEYISLLVRYYGIWFSISMVSILPISIFIRKSLSKDMKKKLKDDNCGGQKWINEQFATVFKVIGYSMAPLIIFTLFSLVISKYLFYFSGYWIVLGTIGISDRLEISKSRTFLSLLLAYILAVAVLLEPLIQII